MADSVQRTPILVTGMHRSGTSWLGRMLCAGEDAVGVQEPLSALHRNTVLRTRVDRWYTYITDENEALFLPYYRDAIAFHPHPLQDLARMRAVSPRDPPRILRHWKEFAVGRLRKRRLLIRDPFAVFSVDWFVRRLGCKVVVIVRDPAAVVSSLKRLGWAFDFANLGGQPLLMSQRLARFAREIEAATETDGDIIEQASLLWKIIYDVVDEFRQAMPDVCVVRHEDLSLDPLAQYRLLYERLGLPFTDRARDKIAEFSGSRNPSEVAVANPFDVRLDSRRNLENWKHRLDADEIRRVRQITENVRQRFYPNGGSAE